MTVTAIVLAGGRSKRFGGDKLAAELAGASILSTTIGAVAGISDGVLVGIAQLPDEQFETEVPVVLVHDPEPYGGPLAALAHLLGMRVEPDPVEDLAIVVGGDMPRVVPAVLRAMLDRLLADPTHDAVGLELTGAPRPQVLPLALRIAPAARAAGELLALEDRSLRMLVERLETLWIPEGDWRALDPAGDTLIDVDTAADLDRLRSAPDERRGGR